MVRYDDALPRSEYRVLSYSIRELILLTID